VSENRISSTLAQGYRAGMQGQPLISAYPQMAQVCAIAWAGTCGSACRPNVDPATGTVEWWSPRPGAVRQVAVLAEHERAPIEALAEQLIREIRQLAELKRKDPLPAGRQMLEQAVSSAG
jgi:hypothetical protein